VGKGVRKVDRGIGRNNNKTAGVLFGCKKSDVTKVKNGRSGGADYGSAWKKWRSTWGGPRDWKLKDPIRIWMLGSSRGVVKEYDWVGGTDLSIGHLRGGDGEKVENRKRGSRGKTGTSKKKSGGGILP